MIKKYGHRNVTYAPSFPGALQVLEEKLQDGDLLITLGAGDVWKIGEEWIAKGLERIKGSQ
jgi:UDP-N-acetylmuramate--alanine ligase